MEMVELGEVARKGSYARGAERIEMPLMGRRACRIHRCTSLSSVHQLRLNSPGEGSLHRHLGARPFSSRSSSLNHGIPLGPATQFTAKMRRKTQLTSCNNARSAEARSPYRILAVAYVLRLFNGLYSIPHCHQLNPYRMRQVTYDSAILGKSVKQGEFGLYPFDQSSNEDRTLINESRTSI